MATADAFPFPTLPAPLRFAIAVAAVGLVYAAERSFDTIIDDGSQFLLLGTAVMATAWFAGTGPALAATVAGALLGTWEATDRAGDRAAHTHLALFVVHGLLLTALVSELRRSRRVAEQQVHEAQQSRRESEAANRMKDEFLGTISHELRTPLNAVLGWVHLLRTGKLDAATASRGLESIDRNVRLQAQLTADLLDVSRALTGTLRVDCQPVSLTDVVQQAAMAAVPAAHAKGVEIRTSIPEAPLMVLGDSTRLRQIAWHLLANAIKFTPRGGSIAILAEPQGEFAVLTVRDSGPGIAPEFLPRVFQRFTQEDPSTTRTVGGLGMGLSLVKDLVELHGGEIRACNGDEGIGAIFTARFPLQPADRAPREPAAAPAGASARYPGASSLEGVRVLVLDRDPEGRELLQTVLHESGATVCTTESVAEALEALEAWRPDVLVSDSVSPDGESYAVVGKVQWLEADRGGRIPAAALTAFSRVDDRVRQMLASVQRDVPKPVEPALLTAEIARLSGRQPESAERSS
jgi:signal transduction histidine kinase/CheY-like chemotaxis protein